MHESVWIYNAMLASREIHLASEKKLFCFIIFTIYSRLEYDMYAY